MIVCKVRYELSFVLISSYITSNLVQLELGAIGKSKVTKVAVSCLSFNLQCSLCAKVSSSFHSIYVSVIVKSTFSFLNNGEIPMEQLN